MRKRLLVNVCSFVKSVNFPKISMRILTVISLNSYTNDKVDSGLTKVFQ